MTNHRTAGTDARQAVIKGKLPRNIVYSIGAVAAVVIGLLGYYYQSRAEVESREFAEARKAAKLKQEIAPSGYPNGLQQTILEQERQARERAAEQAASAVPAMSVDSGRVPVMTAKDFVTGSAGASSGNGRDGNVQTLAAKNSEDVIYTAPIFKGGQAKVERTNASNVSGLQGLADPSDMRVRQENAVAAYGVPTPGFPTPVQDTTSTVQQSDRRFLEEAAASSGKRTGVAGRLPECTVSQGFVIPATFVGGNNSDKPGEFRAMVSQDVYDTVHGKCLAIPVGSTLAGTYSPDIAIGQERLLAAFTRLQLPNGRVVPLLGMQGADTNGYSGVSGEVNSHWLKIFGGALVIGLLEATVNNNQPTATTVGPNGLTTYGNAAGQVAVQTAQTILNRNQSIRPTITTKPGQKLLVQVKHDIVMEAYRDN